MGFWGLGKSFEESGLGFRDDFGALTVLFTPPEST